MTTYGFIEISDVCYCTFPCMHDVIYKGKKCRMGAKKIYNIFLEHPEVKIPTHFMHVKDILRRENIVTINDLEELKRDPMFSDNMGKVLRSALINNRPNIYRYILEDRKFKVQHKHFILCNDLKTFKYLVSLLRGNLDILSEIGTHYVARGGNTICSHAAYREQLEIVQYLLDDLKVPYPNDNPLFELKNIGEETETREYLIQYCAHHNIFIGKACEILDVKNNGLYSRFVNLGLIPRLVFNILSSLRYGDIILTHNYEKEFDTYRTKSDEFKSLYSSLYIEHHRLYAEVEKICHQNLKILTPLR